MKFPTGGTAHEPQGMIRCNSEADSTVWMEEGLLFVDKTFLWFFAVALNIFVQGIFNLGGIV